MLADSYRKTCNNMKRQVQGSRETQTEADRDEKIYWLGFLVNTVLPVLAVICLEMLYMAKFDDKNAVLISVVFGVTFICMNLALIISGVILVRAIKHVKDLFFSNPQVGRVNIKMLWLHSMAYSLFLGGLVIYTLTYIINLAVDSQKTFNILIISYALETTLMLVSQCLLSVIFMGMSKKKVKTKITVDGATPIQMNQRKKNVRESTMESVEENFRSTSINENFKDVELHASIWRQFKIEDTNFDEVLEARDNTLVNDI